ncbi:MAG: hypothetical protein WBM24_15930 [Candidatus Sulfotelmatobacter sp.]
MATTVVPSAYAPSPAPVRRYDHFFFSGMALLILVTIFIGFGRSYYLAGVFQAPLPNRLVHIHGAIFTCWIVLLIAQTLLVSAHRVDIHRRLGLAGFGLACIMPVVAILAAIDSMVRHASRPSALAFFVVPTFDILAFVPLVFFRVEVSLRRGDSQAADSSGYDCHSRRSGGALAGSRCMVGPASLGMDNRFVPDSAVRLRSFFDQEDSSRHAVGQRCVSISPAHPRANWTEPCLADFCCVGAACGEMRRPGQG